MQKLFFLNFFLYYFFSGLVFSQPSTYRSNPNIVILMVDDMGYSDLGCYGGEIETPNLDKLAEGGLRFTQFYNAAKCHTTRAELLTGNYAFSIGDTDMEYGATFGEVLQAIGYKTYISGKWHQNPLPKTRGFDHYYGLADGCSNYFNPGTEPRMNEGLPGRKYQDRLRRWVIEDRTIMGYTSQDKNFYHTDIFTDYAIDYLNDRQGKPFLLYLPFTAPHYPLHAWPEDITKYRGKYKIGWDVVRNQRFKRMKKMGIIGPDHKLSDRSSKKWMSLSEKQKEAEDLKMSVYAAMVDRIDQNLGRLFTKIKQMGVWENTLIIFLSDNGACSELIYTTPNHDPGPVESYSTLSRGWANASNTPYKRFKFSSYEGGIRTPLVVYWKGVVEPGITHQVGHVIDLLPTIQDITGAIYPDEIKGNRTKAPVGISLLPIFKGKIRKGHDEIFWHFPGKFKGIRQGDFKAIQNKSFRGLNQSSWELYDLKNDPTEMENLSTKMPTKTSELTKIWKKWWHASKKK